MISAGGAHHAAVSLQPGNFLREILLLFSFLKADPPRNPPLDLSSRHLNHLSLFCGRRAVSDGGVGLVGLVLLLGGHSQWVAGQGKPGRGGSAKIAGVQDRGWPCRQLFGLFYFWISVPPGFPALSPRS